MYYRVGKSAGERVQTTVTTFVGDGDLIFTNKNLYFYSLAKSVKMPYSKIISVNTYSNGAGISLEGKEHELFFKDADSWFVMNIVSLLKE